MSKWVLDSSAVLAVMFHEKGRDKLKSRFRESSISTVNLAEVFSKLSELDELTDQDVLDFENLEINIVDFDAEHARKAAELRPLTKHLGLSLGDRSCLALTILKKATAVTADKNWKDLDFCPIEVIR